MIVKISYEQLMACLGLPQGATLIPLRQEPEDVLEGNLSFVVQMPGPPTHLPGAKLMRIPFEDFVLKIQETNNGSTD